MVAKKSVAKLRTRPAPVPTKLRWLDAVLGGGIVPGGVYMVVGGPGAGKTTMLMQAMCGFVSKTRQGLYISGDQTEEAMSAVFARANGLSELVPWSAMEKRVQQKADAIDLVCTRHPGKAAGGIRQEKPALVVVGSVDAFRDENFSESKAGHSIQVNNLMECCIDEARKVGAAIVFEFHTTKAGIPAGGKDADRRVDCRLDLATLQHQDIDFRGGKDPGPSWQGQTRGYRQLRAVRNRFGPANVERVLQITKGGLLVEV